MTQKNKRTPIDTTGCLELEVDPDGYLKPGVPLDSAAPESIRVIAKEIRRAILGEREECAKIADRLAHDGGTTLSVCHVDPRSDPNVAFALGQLDGAKRVAETIRARGGPHRGEA